MEFFYAINEYTDEPVMELNQLITNSGYDSAKKTIDGCSFGTDLFKLDGLKARCIKIPINSFGGSVRGAMQIIGAMTSINTPTETCNFGYAESSAGWVLLCGTKVKTLDYAYFMCHMPKGSLPQEDMDRFALQIATIISGASGRNGKPKLSVEKVLAMMEAETYLTAYELYDLGLCDEVITSTGEIKEWSKKNAEVLNSGNGREAYHKKFNEVLNQSIVKNTSMAEEKNTVHELINSTLGLKGDALIADTLKTINGLMLDKEKSAREITNAGEDRQKLADKLLAAEKAKNEADDCYNKLKNEMEAMDAENKKLKEDAEALGKEKDTLNARIEKMETERGDEMIQHYIDLGKIKAEQKDTYAASIKTLGYDAVKNQLEELPTNAPAPRPAANNGKQLAFNGATSDEEYRKALKMQRSKRA